MLTISDPDVVSFVGQCRYGSHESQWIIFTLLNSASNCRNECKNIELCTAANYDSRDGTCSIYKGGPYTYGDNTTEITCYPMSGILTLFVVVVIPIFFFN